jgi:hypothetical protein
MNIDQDAPVPPGMAPSAPGVEFDNSGEDSLAVDLSGVDPSKPRPLVPKGVYDAVIDDAQFGYSNNSGNPMWTLVCAIDGGEYSGRKFYTYIVWTPEQMPRAKQTLQRIAPELAAAKFKVDDDNILAQIQGKRIRIQIAHRWYKEEKRHTENIKQVLPPLGGMTGIPGMPA